MSTDTTRTERVEARIAPDVLIRLSMEEQQRFVSLLLDPPARAPALARAAKAHKKLITSSR